MIGFIAIAIIAFELALLIAAYFVILEQRKLLIERRDAMETQRLRLTAERDLAQQEVRVWSEAVARAARTPVLRDLDKPKTLEKSESYWDSRETIESINAGD